ncbi:MAG: hypothetical protein AAF629_35135, partial [Chloroflexota bacterium]
AVNRLEQLPYLHSPQISIADVYYNHYRILATLGQSDTARVYLQKAYDDVMRQADLIVDDERYDKFLNEVPINRVVISQTNQ